MNEFKLDERLQSSCFEIIDWPLSKVLLKNNAHYPWLILVPRRNHVTEITQLSKEDSYQLMDETQQLSRMMEEIFEPDKINIATLGNMVAQLHVHVVARFKTDPLWPQGVWQASIDEKPYTEPDALITHLTACLSSE
jgi:diadenosine tetraphosphate (Ap4A) HIT family hydrolase